MADKVLLVDDDPNVLKAYERRLRRKFKVETALCSEEGITAVNFLGPFAVVVSDMMMPRENGADFLARLLETSPDSVRIMLTGNADQQTATTAINKSQVFRFLNKPCEADELEAAIQAGIEEHHRIVAEREMFSGTLLGAVEMLSRVLALTSPEAFGRSERFKKLVSAIATDLKWDDAWRHETTALLSQLGYVAVPASLIKKRAAGDELSKAEAASLRSHAQVAGDLIAAIPKLGSVAQVVASQDAATFTEEQQQEGDGPRSSVEFGVRLLKLCRDYDTLIHDDNHVPAQAIQLVKADADAYDADCLAALERVAEAQDARVLVEVTIEQMTDGMQLVQDIQTTDDALLVAKGVEVVPSMRTRLSNYAATHDIQQPVQVLATAQMVETLGLAAVCPA